MLHVPENTNTSIWLFLDSSGIGGIETHVYQLAFALKNNYQITVLFLQNHGPHPLKEALDKAQVSHQTLDGKLLTLLAHVKDKKPALIHSHGYKAGIFSRLIGRYTKTPVISTFHAGEKPKGRLAYIESLDRWSSILSDQRYAVSHKVSSRIPFSNKVLDNFIDTRNLAISYGRRIAFVGRLCHEKGPDRLIDLARECPEIVIDCYGDGPEKSNLLSQKPPNLILHGIKSNMNQVWPEIGLILMPSRFEGLPMTALEAMGRGIPVIASNTGNLSELIEHNNNGWLLDDYNINDWVSLIQHWKNLTDSEKTPIKKAAHGSVEERFSSNAVIPYIQSDYNQLIYRPQHSPSSNPHKKAS